MSKHAMIALAVGVVAGYVLGGYLWNYPPFSTVANAIVDPSVLATK